MKSDASTILTNTANAAASRSASVFCRSGWRWGRQEAKRSSVSTPKPSTSRTRSRCWPTEPRQPSLAFWGRRTHARRRKGGAGAGDPAHGCRCAAVTSHGKRTGFCMENGTSHSVRLRSVSEWKEELTVKLHAYAADQSVQIVRQEKAESGDVMDTIV